MNMINLPSPHLQAASAMILICNFFIHVEKVLFSLSRRKLISAPCIYTKHWCCVQNEGKNVKKCKTSLWLAVSTKIVLRSARYIAYLKVCPILHYFVLPVEYRVNVENIKYGETYRFCRSKCYNLNTQYVLSIFVCRMRRGRENLTTRTGVPLVK